MTKRVTRKDFYMEIRKSPGRFLSILFIVALGVAFFSGIRASEPAMRITGDSYFDGSNLMDIKGVSTLGITDEDIRAISDMDGVAKAEGAYSADFLSQHNDEQTSLHVMSAQREMNDTAVSEGRMPEKVGECLADDETDYKIGDVVRLNSGTDDPVSDTLRTDTLTVVGLGSSPCYISFARGSTTIGTGSINGFLVVPEDTFDLDVYTDVYVQVEGASALLAYTGEYDGRIEKITENLEELTEERGKIRRQELVDDANEELDDAKQELAEGKAEAESELADAEKQIDSAEKQINDAKKQISDGKIEIADAKKLLDQNQKKLDQAKKQYESGKKEFEAGKKKYSAGKKEYDASKPAAEAQIREGKSALASARAQLDDMQGQYDQLNRQIDSLEAQIKAIEGSQGQEKADDSGSGAGGEDEEEDGEDGGSGKKEESSELAGLKEQLAGLKGKAAQMKGALDSGEKEYQTKLAVLNASEKELENAGKELATTKKLLDANEKKLKKAAAQIRSGQKEIDEGWKELQKQEKKLKSGESEISANEAKLADAREEYEDGKRDAEKEIADGEKEIADAQKEIDDIPDAKWYVYDRSTLPEYSGYGENADRMRAIGKVFPVLFFLVAALISLTSMTRMVEEQRIEIGTKKALGYSRFAIASKYLGYALLATAGGSVIGVLFGEKVLPYIIIYAYGIMYHHIPEIITPYNWTYAAMASFAAVACTLFATFAACYRELAAQPAVLMRPPAPKNGKRVFLEHVGIIWRHLNFTWKSTVRNLVRYKKRFFMTVFGIGGCMALMLVGFGLRDSIFEITRLQYSQLQLYDGMIILQDDLSDEEREKLDGYLGEDRDLERFTETSMKSITLTNGKKERQTYECVLDPEKGTEDYVHFRDRRTKEVYELTDDGAIISEKTAKLLGAGVGDSVSVKDEKNGNAEIRIAHICENYMGHYIYLTPKYYEEVYGKAPEDNCILFSTLEGYTKEQMKAAGQKILSQDEVLNVSYIHDTEKRLNDMLKSLNLVIVVLIVSAGMLAFVVLYNLNNINITERQRELATLKVLGFYNNEVAAYVFRENILLTFVGAAAGVVLGRILHLFIIQTVEVDAAMFGRIINFPSYVYSLLFTVAFSLFVNGVMYFKLKKIDMVESLKSIE